MSGCVGAHIWGGCRHRPPGWIIPRARSGSGREWSASGGLRPNTQPLRVAGTRLGPGAYGAASGF